MEHGLVVATTDQLILAVITALSNDNGVEIEVVDNAIRSATEREVMIAEDPDSFEFGAALDTLTSLCLIRIEDGRYSVTALGKLMGGHQLPDDYFSDQS